MKVDLSVPVDHDVDAREWATYAEKAGYQALWMSEVKHDPFLGLTLASTVTESIGLGTSIAVAFARSPMTTAVAANDLHRVSAGRFLLGLGSQVKPHIIRRFSMPWSRPAARMREYICALHAIWQCWNKGTKLDFDGDFYSHTLMTPFFDPGPNPFGPPKVFLAAVGEIMTRVAGEVADGLICHAFATARYLAEVALPALRAGLADSQRDRAALEVCGEPFVVTGRSEPELEQAHTRVRQQIAFYGSTPSYRAVFELHGWGALAEELHGLSVRGDWETMGTLIDDDVLAAFAVIGEPRTIAPQLLARYGRLVDRLTLYTPYPVDAEVLREIASDVQKQSATTR